MMGQIASILEGTEFVKYSTLAIGRFPYCIERAGIIYHKLEKHRYPVKQHIGKEAWCQKEDIYSEINLGFSTRLSLAWLFRIDKGFIEYTKPDAILTSNISPQQKHFTGPT
jgi:hypothetical protein